MQSQRANAALSSADGDSSSASNEGEGVRDSAPTPKGLGKPLSELANLRDQALSGAAAVDHAIATDSDGLQAAKSAMMNTLSNLASDPKAFHEAMEKAFGEGYDQAKAETIRQQVLAGDFSWMPEIKEVDESVLADQSGTQGAGSALGAYSAENDTIYISSQLLESDPSKAAQILTEEVGHSLDARLNTSDAAGDEGDIFARIAGGEEISDSELASLKSENDSGTIMVDGKLVEVEYGFFSKIKKKVKGAFKKVKKAVKSIGEGIIDMHKMAFNHVKKAFKKVMESKLLGQIMMIAQFIPIPVVQIVARTYNLLKAAYQVGQGIKNRSFGMVLQGAAGAVGGVGKLGGLVGASSKFVATAAKVSSGLSTAASAYQVAATGNWKAAAGLAANYFGGTTAGQTLGKAVNIANAVESAKNGDYMNALSSGMAGVDSNFKGNATYEAIKGNFNTISSVVNLVQNGDYGAASQAFLASYGNDLGMSADTQATVNQWAGVVETVSDTKAMVENKNYSGAIESAAGLLGIPPSNTNLNRLGTVFAIRDSVVGKSYADTARHAASLSLQSGQPQLATTFLNLANLLDGILSAPPLILNNQEAMAS